MIETYELDDLVLRIQTAYPQIYLACHARHQRVGRHGEELSDKDSRILAHLRRERPTGAAELAAHLGIRPSTLSEALDRLVTKRYVIRETHPDDRRRIELRLSAAGAAAMSRSSVLDPARLAALLERLAPDERVEAVCGLELLAAATRGDRSF